MKSDKNLIFADIVYFDLIYPSEKKRENSNRGQKMSAKICQKFLYCELTLIKLQKGTGTRKQYGRYLHSGGQ